MLCVCVCVYVCVCACVCVCVCVCVCACVCVCVCASVCVPLEWAKINVNMTIESYTATYHLLAIVMFVKSVTVLKIITYFS